ncbi:MAG: NBR1-Ig-like domain-containing protein [Chloroflexota bacterium]
MTNLFAAQAVAVEALADLDQLEPDDLFTVTWAFRNEGTAVWQNLTLAYTDETHPETADYPHTNLASQPQFHLSELGAGETVPAGDTVYLTMTFVAPPAPGTYLTGWQLQTAEQERFGPVRALRVIVPAARSKAFESLAYQVTSFKNSAANYNKMKPNAPFSGTWTLANSGINAWSGNFKVVATATATADTGQAAFHLMGAPVETTLRDLTGRESVSPGDSVTLKLDFTTPDAPGVYAFHWQLTDVEKRPFGGTRWLRIVVEQPNGAVPPQPAQTSHYNYQGTAVRFFTGIHGPADDWIWHDGVFQRMMQRLNLPVFFWSHGANGNYAHFGNKAQNGIRLYWNPRPVSPDEAYREVRDDQLRHWWQRGYRRFVFFNEPQFGKEIAKIEEGMGIAWHNKEQFARFLGRCLQLARQEFPGIQLFTTPMSSNEAFDPWGWRAAMWTHVREHVDGWCMHAYSGDNGNAEAAAQNIAGQVLELQRRFRLQIPIIVSEASVNRGNNAAQKAQVAHIVHQKLAKVRGVEGVFWYAADWNPQYDHHREGWFRNGIADAYIQQRSI